MLDIVYGQTRHIQAASKLARELQAMHLDGTFYIGYPVIASADEKVVVDALLVAEQHGLIAFKFEGAIPASGDADAWRCLEDEQQRLYYAIDASLGRHNELRAGRKLGIQVETVTVFPTSPQAPKGLDGRFVGLDDAGQEVRKCAPLSPSYLQPLQAALQRVTTIKPRKKRDKVSKRASRGALLKDIESAIANLDQWQKPAAIETPDGPQRIRGLAGSGKTIVLALKAAYLHSEHPDWNIAVTFYTRSLYQQFEDLIRRFSFEHMNDEPDWERLRILHSWGGRERAGIYTEMAGHVNTVPRDFMYGRAKYGMNGAFRGICRELLTQTELEPVEPIYDAVLIDEAQDLPPELFRLIYRFTKDPKRIVWAYDELQTLSESVMPDTAALFGRDDRGEPLVDLRNQEGRPRQDIVLPVCYRNTPWALTTAHALGFGIYRKPGLVQHFDDPRLWEDIGYATVDGTLALGEQVTIERSPTSSPEFFTRLLRAEDAVVATCFDNELAQAEWIANSIKVNLTEDELEPDDILIVLPDAKKARSAAAIIEEALARRKIASHVVGVVTSVDEVFVPGSIALANIFRSKGNEAPMVYLASAQTCYRGYGLTAKRNILFTAITRSRAWVRVCAWGPLGEELMKEIDAVQSQHYRLSFTIPSAPELEKMRRIHRDLSATEKQAIERDDKQLSMLLDKILSGDLPRDLLSAETQAQLDRLRELHQVARNEQ